jgi:ABC transporter
VHSALQYAVQYIDGTCIAAVTSGMLSTYKQVQKKIRQLSGGEKARVALCMFMLRPANLLVLDEPTNHLDIPAKEMVRVFASKLLHTSSMHCQSLLSLPYYNQSLVATSGTCKSCQVMLYACSLRTDQSSDRSCSEKVLLTRVVVPVRCYDHRYYRYYHFNSLKRHYSILMALFW